MTNPIERNDFSVINAIQLSKENSPLPKLSLFREGFRQLKIGGLVYTAICVFFPLGIAFDMAEFSGYYALHSDDSYGYGNRALGQLHVWLNDLAVWLLLFSAVFLTLGAFWLLRYLFLPRARDFYYATPHSSARLFTSFAWAVFAWNAVAMGVTFLVCLAFLLPQDVNTFAPCVRMLVGLLSAQFLLLALVTSAIALTGRLITASVALVGLAVTPSALLFTFFMGAGAMQRFNFYDNRMVVGDILTYLFQVNLLNDWSMSYWQDAGLYAMVTSNLTIGCNLLVGALLTALAVWFAAKRTGDAVGQPFVNKAAHIVTLTVFNLPFACVFAILVYDAFMGFNPYRYNYDAIDIAERWSCLLLVFAVLAAFWLSECLMTFDIKKAHNALPFACLTLTAAAVTMVAGHSAAYRDITSTPAPDEVASFSLVHSYYNTLTVFNEVSSYGDTVTTDWEFTDRDMIKTLISLNNERAELAKQDIRCDAWYDGKEVDETNTFGIRVCFRLRDGRKLYRYLQLDAGQIQTLTKAILRDEAFCDEFFALPDPSQVILRLTSAGLTPDEVEEIYDSFREEFASLPQERKLAYLEDNMARLHDEEFLDVISMPEVSPTDTEVSPSDGTWPTIGEDPADGYYVEEADGYYVEENDWYGIDLVLHSTPEKPGDYFVTSSSVSSLDFAMPQPLTLDLTGYREGYRYRYAGAYDMSLSVIPEYFPETNALIVRISNRQLDRVRQLAADAEQDGTDMALIASYYDSNASVEIDYRVYTSRLEDMLTNGYSHDPDNLLLEYDVSPNEMVEQLYADAKTTERIDFSRPYCKLDVYIEHGSTEGEHMTFWIQTRLPLPELLGLDPNKLPHDVG